MSFVWEGRQPPPARAPCRRHSVHRLTSSSQGSLTDFAHMWAPRSRLEKKNVFFFLSRCRWHRRVARAMLRAAADGWCRTRPTCQPTPSAPTGHLKSSGGSRGRLAAKPKGSRLLSFHFLPSFLGGVLSHSPPPRARPADPSHPTPLTPHSTGGTKCANAVKAVLT